MYLGEKLVFSTHPNKMPLCWVSQWVRQLNHLHCSLKRYMLICGHKCSPPFWLLLTARAHCIGLAVTLWLLDLCESWSYWLSSASGFLTSLHLDLWRLWKSWRNILIYELLLYFCYKANKIKFYCCILFSHFGTRICPCSYYLFYACYILFVRVLEGCLASYFHFLQISGKPEKKC